MQTHCVLTTVRLPIALRETIVKLSDEKRRSISEQVVFLVEQALGQRPVEVAHSIALDIKVGKRRKRRVA